MKMKCPNAANGNWNGNWVALSLPSGMKTTIPTIVYREDVNKIHILGVLKDNTERGMITIG